MFGLELNKTGEEESEGERGQGGGWRLKLLCGSPWLVSSRLYWDMMVRSVEERERERDRERERELPVLAEFERGNHGIDRSRSRSLYQYVA